MKNGFTLAGFKIALKEISLSPLRTLRRKRQLNAAFFERVPAKAGKRRLAAAKSAENSLNPSPLTPLPRLEIPLRPRLSSLRCRCRDFGSRLPGSLRSARPHFRLPQGEMGSKAFTLAEVLITLVIIGVIGALTVPALIQNTQKQEYIAGVKKAYSMLSQVTQQIISEEGSPKCDDGGWACSNEDVYRMYKKYFNNIREALDDTSIYRNNPDTRPRIILADGFIVRFHAYSKSCQYTANGSRNVCAYMDVDVNGEKKPNIVGRDIFDFSLKENGLFPSGCDYAGACGSNGGYGCTCKVLTENAINY